MTFALVSSPSPLHSAATGVTHFNSGLVLIHPLDLFDAVFKD